MEIFFYIKDLLEKNNQVILPGLGSFHTKRTEGFFDEETNTFFPPKETIEFNTSEENTHPEQKNVLIEFICVSKNVSATSADYILSKHIDELKENLEKNGEVDFRDIGKLKQQNAELIFEAEKQEGTSNSFFGLPSLTLPKTAKQESVLVEKVEQPANFSLAEQALNVSVSPNDELLVEAAPKSKAWLYVLLSTVIIALSISALYISRPDIFSQILDYNNKEEKIAVPVLTQQEIEKDIADSIYRNNVVKNLESEGFEVENVKDSANITIKQKVVPNKNNIRYEVIIAAWQTRGKAETHLKKLRENGIDAHIVDDADGIMVKISAATLYNQKDAEKELNRIREELNPEAFIKPIRPLK